MTGIVLVLAIVLIGIVLFSLDRIPLEVTALAIVCLLALTGVLTPAEAFAGFSNETVIFIFALLAMTGGLSATGVMHRAGGWLAHFGRLGPRGFLLGLMLLVVVFSAFVPNTVTTAAFLPAALRGAKASGMRRSKVLMPLAFASILGGMSFLYGTSTNLVVSARLDDLGQRPIGLVELTPAGLPLALLGIAIILVLTPVVLPTRTGTGEEDGRALRGVKLHPGEGPRVGPREHPRELASDRSLLVSPDVEDQAAPRRSKAFLAIAIFVTVLVIGSVGLVPLSVAGVAGVLLMVLTGCLDPKLAFRIDWRVVLLIGSMMALGLAMEKSGAGQFLGGLAVEVAGVGGPRLVLLCLMLLTILLSIPMSNQAAALVMLPVGLSAAAGLDVNPRTFAMGIALAASCSFVTPLEPSCMLVFGPGRYRFSDFFRLGGPLTALMLAALVVLVPWAWPMEVHGPSGGAGLNQQSIGSAAARPG
ncbi:SLC13 family permease [Archangium lansingense]|uniref:SLC13 family permease n=1 Tax=Archangium lansingense TaxID=2995310 RepID=A0ABT4A4S1_9BACT|nr:SLC13 family permease [Archangium lansinium]MCY1076640.1 SLC13 family permease [Archangium lansinium]